MKELDCQGLIKRAVVSRGGFCIKLSHRFIVGVPDLLVKIPGRAAMLIEVKWARAPKRKDYMLEITPRQAQVLRQAEAAGMITGVASFLKDPTLLGFRIVPVTSFVGETELEMSTNDYDWATTRERDELIYRKLLDFTAMRTFGHAQR